MSYEKLLSNTFQLTSFRPGQQQVIEILLAGDSALAVFPTGGGKSLCYQLPALIFDGLTLVVSPLIALMKDQVDSLQRLGIDAARLDSSLSREETQSVYEGLSSGKLKILYVSPERLSNQGFIQRLKRCQVALMAVDEAHCIAEWGHNFRPDYLKLADLVSDLDVQRVLALTATATPEVAKEICHRFAIDEPNHIQTGFYRQNLALQMTPTASIEQRKRRLLERIRGCRDQACIVYVTLQKTAEEVAAFLRDNDCPAEAYHAGLKDEQRSAVQDRFMNGSCPTVVATIAFGMGIDKSDIRAVYHFNLPKSLENYMQEVGRAGRDGGASHCELLADNDDLIVLENFIYGDTPDRESIATCVDWLQQQDDVFDLSLYELSQLFDLRPLVLSTLLTYLELDGFIQSTAPFYSEYKIRLLVDQVELLSRFDERRASFLQAVFQAGKKGRIWLTLTPDHIATELGEDSQRITTALNYLMEQQLIELKVSGLRQGYKKLLWPQNVNVLVDKWTNRFYQREAQEIARLQSVCHWIVSDECLQKSLLTYFGETLESPCGKCSVCQGSMAKMTPSTSESVDEQLILDVLARLNGQLTSVRQIARFLCGISSPQISRKRLSRLPEFGCLTHVGFSKVRSAIETITRE